MLEVTNLCKIQKSQAKKILVYLGQVQCTSASKKTIEILKY